MLDTQLLRPSSVINTVSAGVSGPPPNTSKSRESGLQDSLDLLVFGGGPLTPAETVLITELGLSNCVSSIREASDELLREAYAGAKLFVYPSLCEGFGFPPDRKSTRLNSSHANIS